MKKKKKVKRESNVAAKTDAAQQPAGCEGLVGVQRAGSVWAATQAPGCTVCTQHHILP